MLVLPVVRPDDVDIPAHPEHKQVDEDVDGYEYDPHCDGILDKGPEGENLIIGSAQCTYL